MEIDKNALIQGKLSKMPLFKDNCQNALWQRKLAAFALLHAKKCNLRRESVVVASKGIENMDFLAA